MEVHASALSCICGWIRSQEQAQGLDADLMGPNINFSIDQAGTMHSM